MRAILAVYDKEGIREFAQSLLSMGCEIIATGGTAEAATKLIELSLIDQRKEVDSNIFSPRPQVQSDK